jgi:hypothetical protein
MAGELDRARALKAHFERAAAAEQKNIERLQGQKAMAEKQGNSPNRTTSAAKHHDPDALSRARSAKEVYERAAAGQQKEAERAKSGQAEKRVDHAPTPAQQHRPKSPALSDGPDRQAHQERQRALDKQELEKRNREFQRLKEQAKEDKDREK